MNIFAIRGGKKVVTKSLPHVPWPPPCKEDEKDEITAVRDLLLDRSSENTVGQQFMGMFKDYLAIPNLKSLYVPSIHEGVVSLFELLEIGQGDEIIVSALISQEYIDAIERVGATVVFIDIEKQSGLIDLTVFEAYVTPNTKVVIMTHQWGLTVNVDRLKTILEGMEVTLVEDCTYAYGMNISGKAVGVQADIAFFPMGYNSLVYTGQGAMAITKDELLYDCMSSYFDGRFGSTNQNGSNAGTDDRYQRVSANVEYLGRPAYVHDVPFLSPFHAILGKYSLRQLRYMIQGSNQCFSYFKERIKQVGYLTIFEKYPDELTANGSRYRFKCYYDMSKLRKLPIDGLVKLLKAEGMNIKLCSDLYEIHKRPDRCRNAHDLIRATLILPNFYDRYEHKDLIDQYIAGFRKVQLNLFC